MKNFWRLLLVIIGVILLITGWVIITSDQAFAPPSDNTDTVAETNEVVFIVEMPDGQDRIITQYYQEEQTVFDFMETSALVIEYTEYDFGNYITSIEGFESGADDKYWVYYINGNSAVVGASDYVLQPGDVIQWKFEEEKENI